MDENKTKLDDMRNLFSRSPDEIKLISMKKTSDLSRSDIYALFEANKSRLTLEELQIIVRIMSIYLKEFV